jgi:hypothetical protein
VGRGLTASHFIRSVHPRSGTVNGCDGDDEGWFIARQLPEGAKEKGWGTMGVIVREEYVCDYCGTGINGARALVGRLSLRKMGARGLARNMQVLLHAECSDKLIRYARSLPPETKRTKNGAD